MCLGSEYGKVVCFARVTQVAEYAGIYLKKKQSSEYARILKMSDAVHSLRSLQITEHLLKRIQNFIKHLRWSVLQKG